MSNNLVIQSLHRFAKLGDIYDVKTDSFNQKNIFTSLNFTTIFNIISPLAVNINYFNNKRLQEKLNAFQLTNDYQKISLVSGSINKSTLNNNTTVSSLIAENNSNSTMITGGLVYSLHSQTHRVDLSAAPNRTSLQNLATLSNFKDLYYVSQVKFGVNVIVIFERQEFNDTKRISQQKQLDIILDSIKLNISLSSDDYTFINSFDIRVENYGEKTRMGLPNISTLNNTILSSTNKVPIEYTITSIASVLTLQGQVTPNPPLVSVSSNILEYLLSEYEKFQNIITLLKLYIGLYADYKNYLVLPDSFKSLLNQTLTTYETKLEEFKSFTASSLTNILSLDIQPLKNLFYHKTLDYIGLPEIPFTNEIDFVTKWQQNESMSVLSKDQNKLEVLEACRGNYDNIYILHYSLNSNLSSDYMESFMKFYYRNVNDGYFKSFFILVDLELHGLPITDPYVEHYHGKISNTDFNISNNYNYIQYLTIDYGKVIDSTLPHEKTMMCPGRFCSTEYRKWKCANCLGNIKIQSLKFYCDCGSGVALDSQFKCNDPSHESDNTNGNSCYSNTIYMKFNNKETSSILTLLPNYIKSSELVTLASPINFSVISSAPQFNMLSTAFKKAQSTYKVNDIINIFKTTPTNTPNLNMESLEFPIPAGTTISSNYLKPNHSLWFILNGTFPNDSTMIDHIKLHPLPIFATRNKIFLLNINPTKNGEIFNQNTTLIYGIGASGTTGYGSYQEFFIDITRLSSLLQYNSKLDKLQVQEALIIWKSMLLAFNNISNQIISFAGIPLFTGINGPSASIYMNTTSIQGTPAKPKFYAGQIQNYLTNTVSPTSTSYNSTQNVIKLTNAGVKNQIGAIKILNESITNHNTSWVFKFRFVCTNTISTYYADGLAIVFVPTNSSHYAEDVKIYGNRLGYQNSPTVPTVVGVNLKVPEGFVSASFEVNLYKNPGSTTTSLGNPIPNVRDQVKNAILVYSFDKILTLFIDEVKIFSYPINLQSLLGNYDVAVNASCGDSSMDIYASEFYFYK